MDHIRNFSIIAHIDHGKSTLADRILEITGAVDPKKMKAQMLDSMDLERERGITIKAQAVRVEYKAADGETYDLNLIDTPGHVDFSYEVSRSLAACEGALLVVDAAQGVEAQTVANTYLAIENGLELIPVINKVDLPGAEPERVAGEIADLLGGDPERRDPDLGEDGGGGGRRAGGDRRPRAAARGRSRRAAPRPDLRLRVRPVPRRDRLRADGRRRLPQARPDPGDAERDRGRHRRHRLLPPGDDRGAGDGGRRRRLPDHRHQGRRQAARRRHADLARAACDRGAGGLPRGPADGLLRSLPDRHRPLRRPARRAREARPQRRRALLGAGDLEALGFGFRCGFLGLLHMEIVRERLEREYGLDLLATTPNVRYEVLLTNGEEFEVHSPTDLPDPGTIEAIEEPFIRATIICPAEQVGAVMELCQGAAGPTSTCITCASSGCRSVTTCRWRRSSLTSSTCSSPRPRATPHSTTSRSGQRLRPGQGRRPACR